MAVSLDGERGGRKKRLSAELNLVPYIDLLTCMVAFLLITAVWTQLARLPVGQRGEGGEHQGQPPETRITVLVHQDGFALLVNDEPRPLPRIDAKNSRPGAPAVGDAGDEALDYQMLVTELKALKQHHPDKTDVRVASEDGIRFDTLIKTMDAVMTSGFPDVSLTEAAAGTSL